MTEFIRKSRIFKNGGLFRIVAVTAAGAGLLRFINDSDTRKALSVSSPGPFCDAMLMQCPMVKAFAPRFSMVTVDHSIQGNFQLYLSRVGSAPSEDVDKEVSGKVFDGSKSIAAVVALVGPAVVSISVPKRKDGKAFASGGSGTIIDPDGTILTCAHVVVDFRGKKVTSDGRVDVTLQDGRTFVGTVINADLHSDVAVVKISSSNPLPSAKVGSSHKLCPGDWVVAMGSPHSLHNTITAGIISCMNRKSSEMGLGGMLREYIQIDCAINPGNSGGPLVSLDGEIVGVNCLKHSSASGLSFAVPIDAASKIMEHFKKNGRIPRPWLGLKMLDLSDMIVAQLRHKDPTFPNVDKGVLVVMVSPGSAADLAGLCPGDVVTEFQGKQVKSICEIVELMEGRVGIATKIVVKRARDTVEILTVVPEEVNPEL